MKKESSMTVMFGPGTQTRLEPDRITKIEILCSECSRVEVHTYSVNAPTPRVFGFSDKAAAIAFCRRIWLLRGSQGLGGGQIEAKMVEDESGFD
jgi:hypothetical protein